MKTTLDITELIEHFRDDQDVMPSTRAQYYSVIRSFFAWCFHQDIDWRTVGIAHIIQYKDQLYRENKSNLTIRFYMIVIKIFWRWLENNGIDRNIAVSIRLPRRQNIFAKKPLTIEQVRAFLNAIDRSDPIGKRDYALFVLLFTTGLRGTSVVSIDIGDIQDYKGEKVVWYRNKGDRQKNKFKALTDKCLEAINDYLLVRGHLRDNSPLFAVHAKNRKGKRLTRQTMSYIFHQRLKAVGIQDKMVSLHSTRHTFGVLSLDSAGLYATQVGLNHRSPNTTRIYIRSADERIILENKAGKAIANML